MLSVAPPNPETPKPRSQKEDRRMTTREFELLVSREAPSTGAWTLPPRPTSQVPGRSER